MKNLRVAIAVIGFVGLCSGGSALAQIIDCSLPANYSRQECLCMEGTLPKYSGVNCTARDVGVVLVGRGIINDGCINPNDSADVLLRASVNSTSATRFDIAWFIPLEPTGTGRTGRCQGGYLTPVAAVNGSHDAKSGIGPYKNSDGDSCGEILQTDNPTYFDYQFNVKLPCARVANGFLSIPRCVVWDQNAGGTCNNILQTGADSGFNAKCNCAGDSATDIPGPNVRFSCAIPPGEDPVLDPGESITRKIGVPNVVTGCTPAGSPEQFQCGTAGFFKVVLEFPSTYGTLTATSNGTATIDQAGNTLVWIFQNPRGSLYGVLGPTHGYPPPDPLPSPYYPAPELTYTFTRNSVPFAGQLTFTTKVYWSANPPVMTDPTTRMDLTGWVEQTCLDCGCSTQITTTPVTLASVSAEAFGPTARLSWATATEAGTVGFNVYGETRDGWVKLNSELIPNRDGDSVEPRRYQATFDLPAGVERVLIEDVDLFGRGTFHPPVVLGESDGREVIPPPIPWAEIQEEGRGLSAARVATATAEVSRALRGAAEEVFFARATSSVSRELPPIELVVSRDGVHRVTYEDLLAAGFDLKGVQPQKIGLSDRNGPVASRVVPNKAFGPGSFIEFVGFALDTLYTKANVYRLWVDARQPRRVAEDSTAPPNVLPQTWYMETVSVADNVEYAAFSPTGDPWYQARLRTGTTLKTWDFPVVLDRLAAGGAGGALRVRLFGGIDPPGSPDHHVRVWFNGTLVADVYGDGTQEILIDAPLPRTLLQPGANSLTIGLVGDTGYSSDIVHLEGYSVTYPREAAAREGSLRLATVAPRVEVRGLDAAEAVVYRLAEGGTPALLTGARILKDAEGFTLAFPGGLGGTYFVSTSSALLRPQLRPGRPAADLLGSRANYLIISHPDFLDGLAPLMALRQAQGFTVKVVDVEDVFASYSHSVFDPEALRQYLAAAYARLGTTHVLLVGGDTYDYHDYLRIGSRSFIPSMYVDTSVYSRFAPSDSAMADVDRDGVPDLAIGRLPVRTRAELAEVVEKILQYERRDYVNEAVLSADASDPNANIPFKQASEAMAQGWPGNWTITRAYLDDVPVATARATLMAGIDRGASLTSFVGHSGPSRWTYKGLFSTADVPQLNNTGRPTVAVQWGCWNTYYVNPTSESLATMMLLTPGKGAAAMLGATTLTRDVAENALGRLLLPLAVQPRMTLGEAVLRAKRELGRSQPGLVDVQYGWNLLGDPAMVVQP